MNLAHSSRFKAISPCDPAPRPKASIARPFTRARHKGYMSARVADRIYIARLRLKSAEVCGPTWFGLSPPTNESVQINVRPRWLELPGSAEPH
jgi:hypothetical protein